MKARNKNPLILFFQWLHVIIYSWSGGRWGTQLLAMPILILKSIGRKSGKKRSRALTFATKKNDYFVVASNGGSDYHPNWWLNLKSNPNATINVFGDEINVIAEELMGPQRLEIWKLFVAMEDRYLNYKEISQRKIPVIRLAPIRK